MAVHKFPEGGGYDRDFGKPQSPGTPISGLQAPTGRIHDQMADLGEINATPIGSEPVFSRPTGLRGLGLMIADANMANVLPPAGHGTGEAPRP